MTVRLVKSFGFALRGIGYVLATQANARIHLVAAAIVCACAWILGLSATDWRWIVVCIALVWFAELMNTAFEYLCDVLSPEHHEAVKRAKDIAAGAVLVCAGMAVVVGALTFWPYVVG